MNRYVEQIPPRWWGPKLSPFWIRCWRPLRKRLQFREQRLMEVEIRQLDNLRVAVKSDQGVLITPNHSGHADAYIMYDVADKLGRAFYFMTAWQVFQQKSFVGKWMLRHHGCFSIPRSSALRRLLGTSPETWRCCRCRSEWDQRLKRASTRCDSSATSTSPGRSRAFPLTCS